MLCLRIENDCLMGWEKHYYKIECGVAFIVIPIVLQVSATCSYKD